MQLTINGESKEIPDGSTVSQLLQLLEIDPVRIVVERNLTILKRSEHDRTVLQEADTIELVQFVGGG